MRSVFCKVVVFLGVSVLYVSLAQSSERNMESDYGYITSVSTVRAQPCSSWRFNSGGGYACSSYNFGVSIPDGFQLNQALRQLDDRIRALESRIHELESQQAQ